MLVGHPFNPVYLLPLVELVGGERTAAATIESAAAFYRFLGMRPLPVRKEIVGFIADRLMEALWREALWLVNDDVATTEEIDAAVVYGCGLRWSLMGTFLTFHLAGGEGGMRHMLHQFGPALKLPWTRLVAPELTDASDRQGRPRLRGSSRRPFDQGTGGAARRFPCRTPRSRAEILARGGRSAGPALRLFSGERHAARLRASGPRGDRGQRMGRLQRPHERCGLCDRLQPLGRRADGPHRPRRRRAQANRTVAVHAAR